ncbi:MAG TPA: hypothetical protein VGM39_18200 [Kofleriaceae bacterium]|jgi:hypothetical protein
MRTRLLTGALAAAGALVLALGLTSTFSGCGQDEGDRCQTNDDCSGGLLCNQATQTCARMGGGDIDATVPVIIDALPERDVIPDVPDDAGSDSGI